MSHQKETIQGGKRTRLLKKKVLKAEVRMHEAHLHAKLHHQIMADALRGINHVSVGGGTTTTEYCQ